jgi:hypothetical protein
VAPLVERLLEAGRVERTADGKIAARTFVIPLGASVGWEAAVFDHLQALVQTVCQRLRSAASGAAPNDVVGGSTYAFDVWPGHPFEDEVKGQLAEMRRRASELRQRVDAHNRDHGLSPDHQRVTTYMGQCLVEPEPGSDSERAGEAKHG